ncbi:hypothetical protein [Desulfopila inferna]|uniref:hypothetical protein n=1 Tax=Desulfopila inferna TaxID=468528 RepID=UPI001966BB75|nr:hypothetical protein [Desulfopila inferna]MBM9606492.1 hypothetical protein [Desulfopila inferna]
MPSSTSNSNDRAAKFLNERWKIFWLAVVVFFLVFVASWEAGWRIFGFEPNITDDWPVWSEIRRAANKSGTAVALVGSSRIMVGMEPEVLEEMTKTDVFMLAIDGSNPLPVLQHLAEDPNFIGKVICSLPPYWLAGSSTTGEDRTLKWLRKYSAQPLSSRIETRLLKFVQSHLVFRSSGLSPQQIWSKWYLDEPILPPYAPMRPDRYRKADYSRTDLASLRASRVQRTRELHRQLEILQPGAFESRIERIRLYVEKIQDRGGKVAFIRFPSCGSVREIEEKTVPREHYWDIFAERVSAYFLHFEDYARLSDFKCMDGSHLNYNDAEQFTREVAKLLLRRDFFE